MGDLAAELVRWAPPSLIALLVTVLGNHAFKTFTKRFDTIETIVDQLRLAKLAERFDSLEGKVEKLTSEMQARVSVSDHRESMRQIWDELKTAQKQITVLETVRQEQRKRARS